MCAEDGIVADYETRYLRIVNHTGGQVCAGTLEMLDAEVERLAALMGLPVEAPLLVNYGQQAVTENCEFPLEYPEGEGKGGGCVSRYGCQTRVSTSYEAQIHELVHAIRHVHGIRGPTVLEEGLAVILGDQRPSRGLHIGVSTREPRSMLELVELPASEIWLERYTYGSHFLSFVMDEYGQAPVLAMLSDPLYPDRLDELFERHLGESFARIDERWREESWETSYTTPPPCDQLVPLGNGFDVETTLDCNDAGTLGHFESYLVSAPTGLCFTTEEPTPVSVSVVEAPGRVSLIGYDCHPDDLLDEDLGTGFTIPTTVTYELELTLARCTWLVDFVDDWSEQPHAHGVSVVPR